MNPNYKKALLIFGGAVLLFWAFKKIRPIDVKSKSKSKSSESVADEGQKKNALVIIKAYSEAKKAGENKQFLDEMNAEFSKEYQLKVYTDKGSGKLFVADNEGNKVI